MPSLNFLSLKSKNELNIKMYSIYFVCYHQTYLARIVTKTLSLSPAKMWRVRNHQDMNGQQLTVSAQDRAGVDPFYTRHTK